MAADCELPDKCHKCGEEGHMAKDCEKPDVCRFCGQEGHRAGDCEAPKTHEITKEDGTKVEIYFPTELTDDKLFEQGIDQGINFDKFDNIPVKCGGDNAPNPIASFEKMGLRQILMDNISKSGYKKPTPIQKTAIPCIMNGRDLMGCAQTGSGKTAAFLLPIIHKILEDGAESNSGDSPQKPQAIIIAPTRELAVQIKTRPGNSRMSPCAKRSSSTVELRLAFNYSHYSGELISSSRHPVVLWTSSRRTRSVSKT